MTDLILSIDQGTTSSRAIIFDKTGKTIQLAQKEFTQFFPQSGWVEHDPEEIWQTTQNVCREVLAKETKVVTIGITNQRETTIVWDRHSGKPIYNAIVWQDRRTAEQCKNFKQQGLEQTVKEKTGLLLDPYFSATKIAWILDNVDGARAKADAGQLLCGTVDSFLVWRLTGGKKHLTDATNASRTLLFNIHAQEWDQELLDIFNVPRDMLPDVRDSASDFGESTVETIGAKIPINGIAGDQQAASFGQCCFKPGMIKSTYGTGCFAMINTGDSPIQSSTGMITTVAYRLNGKTTYALEGSIFVAGAAIQWLRDKLKVIDSAQESESLARGLSGNEGVYMVPAFVGLGAPHWNPHARGALFGITRDTGPAQISRAALESVCYQTHDLIDAMTRDFSDSIDTLRIDGGMVANEWLCQMLADVLGITVERPTITETTALGAAYLAGLHCGIFESIDTLSGLWQMEQRFSSTMSSNQRKKLISEWQQAVRSVSEMSNIYQ